MKRLITLVSGLALAAASAAAQEPVKMATEIPSGINAPIVKSYDKFEDATTIHLRPFTVIQELSDALEMQALFIYPGETFKNPPSVVMIAFKSHSDDWRFLYSRNLNLLIDGERLPLGKTDRESRFEGKGRVMEMLSVVVTPQTFDRIANATKIEGKLGDKQFTLTPEQISKLRDFAKRMKP